MRFDRVLLIYLFPGLGDAVLLGPVVSTLQSVQPGAEIHLLLRSTGAMLWRDYGTLDVVIHEFPEVLVEQEFDNLHDPMGPPKIRDTDEVEEAHATLLASISSAEPDVAIDLTLKSGIDSRDWLRASGAATTAGWAHSGESTTFAFPTEDTRHERKVHWVEYTAKPLEFCGVDAPTEHPTWKFRPPDRPAIGKRLIVVPGASRADKRWPAENFAAVVDELLAHHVLDVTLVGAPSETGLLKDIGRLVSCPVEICNSPTLDRLGTAITNADLILGNDTGPIHLGHAAQCAAVTIFGEMSPTVWGPYLGHPLSRSLTGKPSVSIQTVVSAASKLL